jgi:methylated-DNA-protein-cysteine methyltransferase-like protein
MQYTSIALRKFVPGFDRLAQYFKQLDNCRNWATHTRTTLLVKITLDSYKMANRCEKYQRFYRIIEQIPEGKVATYGQIATLGGFPGQARQVGYALNALPEELDIPWQRVINAKGEISSRANPVYEQIQQQILENEGIRFNPKGRIDLKKHQWTPGKN